MRTAAAGCSEKDLLCDLEFLQRLWKRVQHQAAEALPPEVVYTEMDLALRFVRDAFGEDFTPARHRRPASYEKVVSFLRKTSPALVRRVSLYRERVPLFDFYGVAEQFATALRARGAAAVGRPHRHRRHRGAHRHRREHRARSPGSKNLEDTILRTNLEAADEAVRQLRLRDIGGIIVIDFIDMEDAFHRSGGLHAAQRGARARPDASTRVNEMSRLGLVEMTRKNATDGLYNMLTDPCPTCRGQGRVLSEATRRIMVERRMREILRAGKHAAYLFGLNPETYAIVNAPGQNVVASCGPRRTSRSRSCADPDCGAPRCACSSRGAPAPSSGRCGRGEWGGWPALRAKTRSLSRSPSSDDTDQVPRSVRRTRVCMSWRRATGGVR